jgi:hypothetical protein
MSKEIPFDRFIIEAYEDGYLLQVDKMRPRNAPAYKFTQADRSRKKRSSSENLKLSEEGLKAPMQTIDEVIARIKSYGGIR